ncbi:hypothetical protein [Sulfoacidibacillus thermotolerans]|uniref:hypothetical protein n=1 Tax=Sulfoacidibacillus thermotolerans TaxID=1765684 RepID=UPI000D68A763|nr:hypothetical protein [Sulfoacidibacillus thermotolerans]
MRSDLPIDPGEMGLLFLEPLPKEEVIDLLRVRLQNLYKQIESLENTPKHKHYLGFALSLDHRLMHMQVEVDWLTKVIQQLTEAPPQTDQQEDSNRP